jgi:pimeloyl-ACP methyl ester carboxylesterase
MAAFAGDCASILKDLECYPAHVMGISLGGMVAFQLAVDYPDLIRKLVIVNAVPDLVPSSIQDMLSYWQRLLIIRLLGMEKMGQVLADRFFTGPGQESLKAVFVKRWSENHKPSYRASLKAAFGWSIRDRLGEIKAPTLVIGADGDYFPVEDKVAYTALIPEARLVVVNNSKHALPAEKPQEFNDIAENFLRS